MRTICCFISLFAFVWQLQAQRADFAAIDFNKPDSIALAYKSEQLNNLPELSHKLTSGLTTDVERFRAVYRWVCANIANDYLLYARNMHKRRQYKNDSLKLNAWNNKFREITLKKLQKRHSTICTGYAYLLQELATEIGIPCEIVHGYARTSTVDVAGLTAPNHSWNAVLLNGKWYLCDPTWAAGVPDPETNIFRFKYNDGFFLAEPRLFAINHYPADAKWVLLPDNAPTFTNFLEAPVLYGSAYSCLNYYQQPEKMHYSIFKNEHLHYQFEVQQPVTKQDIKLLIDSGAQTNTVYPDNISIINNSVSMDYAFDSKGFYDVHLYIKDQLVSTHTVRVNAR